MADSKTDDSAISSDLLVLELVLLRVPSPACLVRAAAVCKQWRRVVADASFLRLHGSLHTPAVVAGYYFNRFSSPSPSFLPSQTTPSSAIDPCHFSLDFLPDFHHGKVLGWRILDSRGSLLLMRDTRRDPAGFPYMLVVCSPLTRCYKKIPTPPNLGDSFQLHGVYLVDGDDADEAAGGCVISMSNFRVLCEVRYDDGITHAAVFTASGGVCSWSDKAIGDDITARRLHHTLLFGRAGGNWHFLSGDRTLIALDGHTGEYSSFVLPTTGELPGHLWNNPVYIADGRDGQPRIFSAVDNTMKVFARLNGQWALEKQLVLEEATRGLPGYKPSFFNEPLLIWTWVPGFVTLMAWAKERWLFSVDLTTMEVKPARADMEGTAYQCDLPWPPILRACLDS